MRNYKQTHAPSKMTTETLSASQTTRNGQPSHSLSHRSQQNGYIGQRIEPARTVPVQHSSQSTARKTDTSQGDSLSMVVQLSQVGLSLPLPTTVVGSSLPLLS